MNSDQKDDLVIASVEARRSHRRASLCVDRSQHDLDSDINRRFGARIRESRELQGLTQAEVATSALIDRSYLAQIERGRRRVSLEIAVRLAKSLGHTIADLLQE